MKLQRQHTLSEIAALINANFIGDASHRVTGINEIHRVETGDLTFVDFEKYYQKALTSAATTILIDKETECPEGKGLIVSDNPFRDYNFLTKYFAPLSVPKADLFVQGENVTIGSGTVIHPGVVLGRNISIGHNCIIYPNVVIYDQSIIGNNVIIQANSTIGGDAFYYKRRPDHYEKMHTCGRTILHDWVEIGSNSSIDRGVSGDTIIGRGTKIDNLCQVGHDTIVGQNCIIASQCGIAGVTTIEAEVLMWGQVGVTKDITVGKGAIISAQSGVSKSLVGGKAYFGSPAKEHRTAMIELAYIAKLPEMMRKKGKE